MTFRSILFRVDSMLTAITLSNLIYMINCLESRRYFNLLTDCLSSENEAVQI